MNSFIEQRSENGYYISSWRHNNPLPEFLKTISSSEFETLLSLYISLGEIKQKDNIDTIKKHIESKFFEKAQVFEEEKSLKDRKIKELQESYNILHTNFSALQDSQQKNIDKEHKFFLSQVENIKSLALSKDQQIQELKEELSIYKNQSLIQQNSSKKGKLGEKIFEELTEQYTDWNLKNTTGVSHSGDHHTIIRDCKTLFEIKYYKHPVTTEQVTKFKNNMNNFKDKPLGILLSHTSRIVNGPADLIYCEINSNNQLLVYVQNFLTIDPEIIFSVLNNYIDMAKIIYNRYENSLIYNDLQSKINSIKPILNDLTKDVNYMINKLTQMKKSWNQKIDTDFNELKNDLSKPFDSIKRLMNILFPEETTNVNMNLSKISNMLIEDSEGEKKKASKRKKKSITPVVVSNE